MPYRTTKITTGKNKGKWRSTVIAGRNKGKSYVSATKAKAKKMQAIHESFDKKKK